MPRITILRRWPTAVAIAIAAIAVGSVVGVPGEGHAAAEAVPSNTGTPTISGSPQSGATLTASNGTWTNTPTSYTYAWSKCDQNGNTCAAITGATASTYKAQDSDVGGTLRVTVTASNADGAGSPATSVPTAVVSSATAPAETAPPTISGTAAVGSTLTAANGTWNGSPTGYTYAWARCDALGNACAPVAGQTAQTYAVTAADTGTTIRVVVTATNSAGSTSATSAQTAVVPTVVATGCPSGTGVMQIADVTPPARLQIDQQTITPGVVTPNTKTLVVRARVTACDGRPVQGASLYATAVPFNQFSVPPESITGADGVATLTMTMRHGFPAARQQQLLVVFFRARKTSDPLTGGISTRLLVSFPVKLG
jgi:hypothetical protein